MTADLNPLTTETTAPSQRRAFRNVVQVVSNEIIDMPAALKSFESDPDAYVPYWQIIYESHDVVTSSGAPLRGGRSLTFGTKLLNRSGQKLGEDQRPYVCAQAFAAFGIVAFPGSDNYDESEVIGRSFVVESTSFPTGKNTPIPVEDLGLDFEYTGEVRQLPPRGERNGSAPTDSTGTPDAQEISGNATLEDDLRSLVSGAETEQDAMQRVLSRGFGRGMTLGGEGLSGLAVKGGLLSKMDELGIR